MKDDIILSSKELYTQKKNKCNGSFNLISLKCGTSVKKYLSNIFCPACILVCNKNKALYRFLIDLKKFVKLLILSKIIFFNLKYLWGFAPHPTSFIGIKEAKELHLIKSSFLCIGKNIYIIFNLYIPKL